MYIHIKTHLRTWEEFIYAAAFQHYVSACGTRAEGMRRKDKNYMSKRKNRTEIPEKDKWNIEKMYPDNASAEADLNASVKAA